MYSRFCTVLRGLRETEGSNKEGISKLCTELLQKEEYLDEMRDTLSAFLIECSHAKISSHSEARITYLLQVIVALESMSDECYSISRLLEKRIDKDFVFKDKQLEDLIPYVGLVEEFLGVLEKILGPNPAATYKARAAELENEIDKGRKKLQKLGRKRIEAGKNVKTELMFIDLVRRIEKLGDYCFDIAAPKKTFQILGNTISFKFGKRND
jgi:phosphate:Na+ symporter